MNSASFAALLRRHRMAGGLTQEELAERAGLSLRAISDLERGVRRIPYRETVRALAQAMDLSPQQSATLEAAVPRRQGPTTLARAGGNIPPEGTTLIGREREEAEAVHLLRWAGVRVLTLTGPGGVGKTRLAMRVALTLETDYADGVFFVSLASLRDPALVVPTIAATLGLVESGGQRVLDTLVGALRRKEALLLLDNVEQVIEAAPEIELIAGTCPGVSVLATSRTPLGVRAETVMDVEPLALPGATGLAPTRRLSRYPAINLFVERARAALPEFVPDRTAMAAITEICRRLDGLPLAIELASARMRIVGPAELLALLEHRLTPLPGEPLGLPERQRTMRDTIAWSYDLLDDALQRLFRELSVFSNGFELDAAVGVATGLSGDTSEALDAIASLAESSLIRTQHEEPTREPVRFTMLETIREFGVERLEIAGESSSLRGRHAAYVLSLFQEASHHLRGADQTAWLQRLEMEHDNLRSALRFLLDSGNPHDALRLAIRAARFWWLRSHLTEGRRWLDEALHQAPDASDDIRADALCNSGVLALAQGDYGAAGSFLVTALRIARDMNDLTRIARTQNYLAVARQEEGQYDLAVGLHEETLALWRRLGNALGVASSLNNLAIALELLGRAEQAQALLRESLDLQRDLGDTRGMASTLHNLGNIALTQGHIENGVDLLDQALALYADVGDRRGIAKSRGALARAALERLDIGTALELATESVDIAHQVGDTTTLVEPLTILAELSRLRGDVPSAVHLFAAAQSIRVARGSRPAPRDDATFDAFRMQVSQVVDDETWDRLWNEGTALDEASVMNLARRLRSLP